LGIVVALTAAVAPALPLAVSENGHHTDPPNEEDSGYLQQAHGHGYHDADFLFLAHLQTQQVFPREEGERHIHQSRIY
jgi:hypothetical protein